MRMLYVGAVALIGLSPAWVSAQDPLKVDPKHYKLELENDSVRVLRVTMAPGERSPMHVHPAYTAVFLTDGKIRFALPGGKTAEHEVKRGGVAFAAAESHGPENIGSAPFELLVIEQKSPAGRK